LPPATSAAQRANDDAEPDQLHRPSVLPPAYRPIATESVRARGSEMGQTDRERGKCASPEVVRWPR
jgi:hypothetical protein